MLRPAPPVPDHPALEQEILAWWEERGIFEKLREQNRGGPIWSFVDGQEGDATPLVSIGPEGGQIGLAGRF